MAYRRVEVPSATGVFSLVGARPLSWGGGLAATTKKSWALLKELLRRVDARGVDGCDH